MPLTVQIAVAVVALLHFYFMVLEMLFWDKPIGMRIFGHDEDTAKVTRVLAANQGLYNGFLAAGLFWGLSLGFEGRPFVAFFLTCVAVAGMFGGMTAAKKIFFVQGLPAVIALVLLWLL